MRNVESFRKQSSPTQTTIADGVGYIVEKFGRSKYVDIQYPNANATEYLNAVQDYLETGSVIFYFVPHTHVLDPVFLTEKLIWPLFLQNQPQHEFAWITAAKIGYDFPGVPSIGTVTEPGYLGYSRRGTFTEFPAFQNYLLDDLVEVLEKLEVKRDQIKQTVSRAAYRDAQMEIILLMERIEKLKQIRTIFNNSATEQLQAFLKEQVGHILAIAPEATRNDKGHLLRPNSSLGVLAERYNCALLGVSFGNVQYMANPFSKLEIRLSEPILPTNLSTWRKKAEWNPKFVQQAGWTTRQARLTGTDLAMYAAAQQLSNPGDVLIDGIDPKGVYSRGNIIWTGNPSQVPSFLAPRQQFAQQ